MQLNFTAREVTIKLVYYGPALSGKTTNLKSLHEVTQEKSHGRLMTLETKDDRTLFFDMLPLVIRPSGPDGMNLRIKVFTVPGQVLHSSTRRLVLQGADGIAFIADSQVSATEANGAAFVDLRSNLQELGRHVRDMPLVIQFNKRDMPNARKQEEIETLARRGKEPVYTAIATNSVGVVETFFGLLQLTWSMLEAEHDLSRKIGIPEHRFLGMAADSFGIKGDLASILSARVGSSTASQTEPRKG